MSEREDNLETEVKQEKKVLKRRVMPKVEEKKVVKDGDIIEEDGIQYRVKMIKGNRRHADGTLVPYLYPRKYPIKEKQQRGRKAEPNKFKLRMAIKNLSEEKCLEILAYINKDVDEDIEDESEESV